jgi:hypothetical protein
MSGCHLLNGAQNYLHREQVPELSYSCEICGEKIRRGVMIEDEKFCEDHSHYLEYGVFYLNLGLDLDDVIALTHKEIHFEDTGFTIRKGR